MVVVKLDYHIAEKTPAITTWYLILREQVMPIVEAEIDGIVRIVHSTFAWNKTHWDLYVEIPDKHIKYVKLLRIRVSNRGNVHVSVYEVKELEVKDEKKLLALKALER